MDPSLPTALRSLPDALAPHGLAAGESLLIRTPSS